MDNENEEIKEEIGNQVTDSNQATDQGDEGKANESKEEIPEEVPMDEQEHQHADNGISEKNELKIGTSDQHQIKDRIIGRFIETTVYDQQGFMIAVDYLPISNVMRTSFNVVTGELILYLPETVGEINDMKKEIKGNQGKVISHRYGIVGKIGPFKVMLVDKEDITKFLEVYLGADEYVKEFKGFDAHDYAMRMMKIAYDKKVKEEDEKNKLKKV